MIDSIAPPSIEKMHLCMYTELETRYLSDFKRLTDARLGYTYICLDQHAPTCYTLLPSNKSFHAQEKADVEESDPDFKKRFRFSRSIAWINVNTPLHKFSLANKLDAVLVLLKNGAQTEVLNAMGRTALLEAVAWNRLEVVKLLTKNGANSNTVSGPQSFEVDAYDRWWYAGRVPLHEAFYNSNAGVVDMLVQAGADYNHTSPGGWTILDLAILQRDRSIINLLLQHGAQISRQHAPGEYEPPSLQESARLLLAHRARFPSDECRKAYLHVAWQSKFIAACKDPSTLRNPLGIFLDLLSQAVELPNPEVVDEAQYCISCTDFLAQSLPHSKGPFDIHPNRHSLSQTSKNCCCLCAVVEDAFELGADNSAAVHPEGDNEDEKPLNVFVAIDEWSHHLTVSRGEQEKKLDLYPMSGERITQYPRILK